MSSGAPPASDTKDHSAGRGLGHPHGGLLRGLGRVAPEWMRVGIGSGDVGDRFTLHDGLRHASLLCAIQIGVLPVRPDDRH